MNDFTASNDGRWLSSPAAACFGDQPMFAAQRCPLMVTVRTTAAEEGEKRPIPAQIGSKQHLKVRFLIRMKAESLLEDKVSSNLLIAVG